MKATTEAFGTTPVCLPPRIRGTVAEWGLWSRSYNPATGRFVSMDPFADEVSDPRALHKYLYAGADPINNVDPSGKEFSFTGLLSAMAIGGAIGGAAGGIYAYATGRSIWKGILLGGGIGAALGAAFYLGWVGLGAFRSGALQRFFWDPRTFQTISRQYWQRFGPANGSSLHHWLLPQRLAARWNVPRGVLNAGFNLLRLPRMINTPVGGLNQWMGFARRWGGQRKIVAMMIENGIRVLIPVSGYASYRSGEWLGNDLADQAIQFVEGGVTFTPLNLTSAEEEQMQDEAGRTLQEELEAAN
jgi:hypothetical protein